MGQDSLAVPGGRCRQGRFPLDGEGAQVHVAGGGVAPAQVPGGHHERGFIAQYMAQVVQFAAQIGQRLRVRRIWPERPGDQLPGLGDPGVGDQVRDEGSRARRTRLNGGPVVGDYLLPQEGHAQHLDAAS